MKALYWGLGLLTAGGIYAGATSYFLRERARQLRGYVDEYLQLTDQKLREEVKMLAISQLGVSSSQFDLLVEQVRRDNIAKGVNAVTSVLIPRV